MKIIVAPDKFKGSLTSFEVSEAITKGVKKNKNITAVYSFPMADGGDGFAEVLSYYGDMITVVTNTADPLNRPIQASWQWNAQNKTAVIEVASASGLVLLTTKERNPLLTSTYGTGLLIKAAIEKGAETILLGLGGSATNDAGTGILSALGFDFFDEEGKPVKASGENLSHIKKIGVPSSLPAIKMEIACDVENVLTGEKGAAWIYAPQKGAGEKAVNELDIGLTNFARVIELQTGKQLAGIPGTGAAGGIAAGLMAFFPVALKSGIELVVEASKIKEQLRGADLLITGEGKLDNQSGQGKVVGTMAKLAAAFNIPCMAICGILQLSWEELSNLGIEKAIAIRDASMSMEIAMKNAASLVEEKALAIVSGGPKSYTFY